MSLSLNLSTATSRKEKRPAVVRQSSHHSNNNRPAPALPPSTTAFWHRLLFGSRPAPRLLKHLDYAQACDEQVYILLALICVRIEEEHSSIRPHKGLATRPLMSPPSPSAQREYILPWYSKLTRDRTFLTDFTAILASVVQALEDRTADAAQSGDLAALLARDVPTLLNHHVAAFHQAQRQGVESHSGHIEDLFLRLCPPHIAFDADQQQPEADPKLPFVSSAYLSALVEGLLADLLPQRDYAPLTERAVAREILLYVGLANLFTRLAKPWFIHSIVVKLCTPPPPEDETEEEAQEPQKETEQASQGTTRLWSAVSGAYSALFQSQPSEPKFKALDDVDLVWPTVDLMSTMVKARQRPVFAQLLWFLQFAMSLIYLPINKSGSCAMLGAWLGLC